VASNGDNGRERIRGLRSTPKCRKAERKPRTHGEAFRKLLQVERRVSIMKVLVTVKEVAEPDDDFAIEDTDIAASDLEYDLNEWDDYAIEAAVQLAEAGIADEVVTVTIGPERAEETIRMALAKGPTAPCGSGTTLSRPGSPTWPRRSRRSKRSSTQESPISFLAVYRPQIRIRCDGRCARRADRLRARRRRQRPRGRRRRERRARPPRARRRHRGAD